MRVYIIASLKQAWLDKIWPWIIACDLWNFAYDYNCIADHSFYCGLALLLSCTMPAFWIKIGWSSLELGFEGIF